MCPAGRCRLLSKASLLQQTNRSLCHGHQPQTHVSGQMPCARPARALVEMYWPTSPLHTLTNTHLITRLFTASIVTTPTYCNIEPKCALFDMFFYDDNELEYGRS